MIGPISAGVVLRPHRFAVLFCNDPDRAEGDVYPIMFFQLASRPGEGIIRSEIRNRPLQGGRAAAAGYLPGL